MKLFEINETKDINESAQLIKENCKQFIREGAPVLYRGIKMSSPRIKNINSLLKSLEVRKNRNPSDSSKQLHALLNNFFNEHMGVKIRSEAMFCTGSSIIATQYGSGRFNGSPPVVIPIGDFEYTWSPIIDDAFDRFEQSWYSNSWSDINKLLKSVWQHLDLQSDIQDPDTNDRFEAVEYLLDEHGKELYKFNTDLKEAAKSKNEIMIVCDEYYILENNEYYDFTDVLNKAKE